MRCFFRVKRFDWFAVRATRCGVHCSRIGRCASWWKFYLVNNALVGAARGWLATWEAEKCLAWKVSHAFAEVRARAITVLVHHLDVMGGMAKNSQQIIWELLPSIHPSIHFTETQRCSACGFAAGQTVIATYTGALWETTMRQIRRSRARGHFCFISAHRTVRPSWPVFLAAAPFFLDENVPKLKNNCYFQALQTNIFPRTPNTSGLQRLVRATWERSLFTQVDLVNFNILIDRGAWNDLNWYQTRILWDHFGLRPELTLKGRIFCESEHRCEEYQCQMFWSFWSRIW
jgi:hypothetical protein